MADQIKKISFGFSKLAKKTAIVSNQLNKTKPDDVSKVEFIDCLEGKSIKLKDPVKLDQGPLIIPLIRTKEEKATSQLVNSDNAENKSSTKGFHNKPEESSETVHEETEKSHKIGIINKNDGQTNETLEEIAAREILEELNRKKGEEDEKRVFSVPLTSNAPSGEKESTLEDYDNVPVDEFGMAMLRGMGWAPGKGIGKTEKLVAPTLPTLRPKGMGLGADKVIKLGDKKISNEELKMVKGSFIRVLAGNEKDAYGQIEGFDDESGRLIVKLALKNVSISLNEFMVQLVDASEFKKNSKVINVGKYEQYKEDEVKKESTERVSKNQESEKTPGKEPLAHYRYEKLESNSKGFNKIHLDSCEGEEKNLKDVRTKVSLDLAESRSSRSPKKSSRSPSNSNKIKDSSKPTGHKFESKNHEVTSKYYKSSTNRKHRSHSSDSCSSSSSSRSTKINRSNSSKTKSSFKDRSVNRQRSSSVSSTSDSSANYSRKKKNKYKKKKSSSNKYRSRSRSRSPRKHKHKKSKKE